ncbi:MAG: hypothetical protein FGM24_01230 [Candidatus Kapabacteria bacterium]|nr:hypothetical protein [Candidatus Kapabacteria bacterium]
MANKSLKQRISDLSHDELLSVVVAAMESEPSVRKLFAHLTSSRNERIAAIKGDISKLGAYGAKGRAQSSKQVAASISSLADRINRECGDDAEQAFILLSRLLATETQIRLRRSDSFDPIINVMAGKVTDSLVGVSQRLSSADVLTEGLGFLLDVGHFRGVAALFRRAGAELPDETVDTILALVAASTAKASDIKHADEFEMYHGLAGIILSSTGRIEAFRRHVTVNGVISSLDRITLAEMYLDHGNYKGARVLLDELSATDYRLFARAQAVLERYLGECPEMADCEGLMRSMIVKHNKHQLAARFLQLYGDDAYANLLGSVMQYICTEQEPDTIDANMLHLLVHEGYGDEIAGYVEGNYATSLSRNSHSLQPWVALAESLASCGHPRPAALLFRLIVNRLMLAGADAYDTAATLFSRVQDLSRNVGNWGPHEQHKDFMINFRLMHANKRKFWSLVG